MIASQQLRRGDIRTIHWHLFLLTAAIAVAPCAGHAASIIWGTHEGRGATLYWTGETLWGIRVPGGPVDFSKGCLVQLIKAVGACDDPFPGGAPDPAFLNDTQYTVNDVILDEVHVGYGIGPPGAPALGEWSRTVNVDLAVDDVLYVRGYNMSKN